MPPQKTTPRQLEPLSEDEGNPDNGKPPLTAKICGVLNGINAPDTDVIHTTEPPATETTDFKDWFHNKDPTTNTPPELSSPAYNKINQLEPCLGETPQEPQDTRSRIHGRILIMEKYLANMTRPVQNPVQAYEYVEYIRRIKNLTLEANTDIETATPSPESSRTPCTTQNTRHPQYFGTYTHGKHPTLNP